MNENQKAKTQAALASLTGADTDTGTDSAIRNQARTIAQQQTKAQIRLAELKNAEKRTQMAVMANRYGLTGGEAYTAEAGLNQALDASVAAIQAQADAQSGGEITKIMKGLTKDQQSNSLMVNNFVKNLYQGINSGTYSTRQGVKKETLDLFEGMGVQRADMEKVLNAIYDPSTGQLIESSWEDVQSLFSKTLNLAK